MNEEDSESILPAGIPENLRKSLLAQTTKFKEKNEEKVKTNRRKASNPMKHTPQLKEPIQENESTIGKLLKFNSRLNLLGFKFLTRSRLDYIN